jgi:hypothetical protein
MYEDLLEIPLTQQPVEVMKPSEEGRDMQAMIELRQRVCAFSVESAIESAKVIIIIPFCFQMFMNSSAFWCDAT